MKNTLKYAQYSNIYGSTLEIGNALFHEKHREYDASSDFYIDPGNSGIVINLKNDSDYLISQNADTHDILIFSCLSHVYSFSVDTKNSQLSIRGGFPEFKLSSRNAGICNFLVLEDDTCHIRIIETTNKIQEINSEETCPRGNWLENLNYSNFYINALWNAENLNTVIFSEITSRGENFYVEVVDAFDLSSFYIGLTPCGNILVSNSFLKTISQKYAQLSYTPVVCEHLNEVYYKLNTEEIDLYNTNPLNFQKVGASTLGGAIYVCINTNFKSLEPIGIVSKIKNSHGAFIFKRKIFELLLTINKHASPSFGIIPCT